MGQYDKSADENNALTCTQKCLDALESKTDLKVKSRQYCILLNRADRVSLELSQRVGMKVDVSKLIEDGYILDSLMNEKSVIAQNKQKSPLSIKPKVNIALHKSSKPMFTSQSILDATALKDIMAGKDIGMFTPYEDVSDNISPTLQFATGEF